MTRLSRIASGVPIPADLQVVQQLTGAFERDGFSTGSKASKTFDKKAGDVAFTCRNLETDYPLGGDIASLSEEE